MKLELGKIKIDDIQFAEKTYVKDLRFQAATAHLYGMRIFRT